MTIEDFFEVEELRCVEPSFAELAEDYYTGALLDIPAEEGRLLVDEEEMPVALALKVEGSWQVGSFVARPPVIGVIEKIETIDAEIYQAEREAWCAALREYYADRILAEVPLPLEDTREGRQAEIRDLLAEIWEPADVRCLDCCCGSGVGSAALRELGMRPLAYDNDPALLALGFSSGRLEKDAAVCIDGRIATAYLPPAERGVAMMLGDITNFNAVMWEEIVYELLALSAETVITVATEPEVRRVAEWCDWQDRPVEVFEHDRDPIYDRWVCVARQG